MQFKPGSIFEAANSVLEGTPTIHNTIKAIEYMIAKKTLKNNPKDISKAVDTVIAAQRDQFDKAAFKKAVLDGLTKKPTGGSGSAYRVPSSGSDPHNIIHSPVYQDTMGL